MYSRSVAQPFQMHLACLRASACPDTITQPCRTLAQRGVLQDPGLRTQWMQDTGQVSMASCTFSSGSTRCCITRARLRGGQPRCCVSRRHWVKIPVSALQDGQQGQGSGLHKAQRATLFPPAPDYAGLRNSQTGQFLQTNPAASCCPGKQWFRKVMGSQLGSAPILILHTKRLWADVVAVTAADARKLVDKGL